MTRSTLQARREALIGTGHYVQFYGGWHCINEVTGRATRAKSQEHAVMLAEARNAEVAS